MADGCAQYALLTSLSMQHFLRASTHHFLRALFFWHTMSALLSSFICGFAEVFLVTRAVSSYMHDVPQSPLHFPREALPEHGTNG